MAKKKANKKAPSKAPSNKKGKSALDAEVVSKKKSNTSSSSSNRNGLWAMSLFFLLAGILTPPLVELWKAYYLSDETESSSSASTPRDLEEASPSPSNRKAQQPKKLILQSCDLETSEDLQGFVTQEEVPGMHTLCFHGNNLLTIFQNSQANKRHEDIAVFSGEGSTTDWKAFKENILEERLSLTKRRYPVQAWAIFDKEGHRVLDANYEDLNDEKVVRFLRDQGILVLMEGGQWVWPGIREGYIRKVKLDDEKNEFATLETLSLHPLVLSVEGFLTDEECNYIQETASPMMKYSDVTLMDKDKGRPASDFRTSQSTFLGPNYKGLTNIDYRTSSLVRVPRSHQEHVQVLRYGNTEKYNAHHDYFDPRLYQNDPKTLRLIQNGNKNRMSTVFWYLTDVAKGGETIFPRYGSAPPPRDMADCTKGLKVKPQRGKVIIFYSMTPEGTTDTYSLHGACPVEEGIKWAANKWVWNQPTGFYRD
mmetsp:Transcript_6548/g.9624  ORF Transcript_6548/g.9624 Transcript_6548/m.9624 type:complete len:479 (+) Transcript_6548:97-1533(+)